MTDKVHNGWDMPVPCSCRYRYRLKMVMLGFLKSHPSSLKVNGVCDPTFMAGPVFRALSICRMQYMAFLITLIPFNYKSIYTLELQFSRLCAMLLGGTRCCPSI
jgi:hypothetical protein